MRIIYIWKNKHNNKKKSVLVVNEGEKEIGGGLSLIRWFWEFHHSRQNQILCTQAERGVQWEWNS